MKELEVQKYLRSGKPVSSLAGPPYNLIIKEQGPYVLLKYNQILSDFNEPIVKECRGIILYNKTWDVLCYPFNKFFNYNEPFADKLEGKLTAYSKQDGSLVKVWHSPFEGKWMLSSNGSINMEDNIIDISGVNMASLFERCLSTYKLNWELFTKNLNPDYTYMYEMATQDNRIVVPYKGYQLFYLGQRNNKTFQEEYIPDRRIGNVKIYNFKNIDDVIKSAEHLPDNEEGYVVRDEQWHRVKVKNPVYFMLHKLANNGKPAILDYVLEGNENELLGYFPEYKEDVEIEKAKIRKLEYLAEFHKRTLSSFYDIPRKDFATLVSKRGIPTYLQSFVFKTYSDHNLTWQQFTADWDIYKWKNLLERARKDLV